MIQLTPEIIKELGCYCFACGNKFTKGAVDGGLCLICETSICSASDEEIEKEFRELKSSMQNVILKDIKRKKHAVRTKKDTE